MEYGLIYHFLVLGRTKVALVLFFLFHIFKELKASCLHSEGVAVSTIKPGPSYLLGQVSGRRISQ